MPQRKSFSTGISLSLLALLMILPSLVGCSESEQRQLQSEVARSAQTAVAEGVKHAETQLPYLKETAAAVAATQLAKGQDYAATQAALLRQTMEARLAMEFPKATPIPTPSGPFATTLKPPFDSCNPNATHSPSAEPNSIEILERGFSVASASCDAKKGSLNHTIVLFGGKNGSILEAPSHEATASSDMAIKFVPPFTGRLKITADLLVNAKIGAAAGSATSLPDFEDVVSSLILPEVLDAFLTTAKGFIFATAAGVRTDAYLVVDAAGSQQRVETLVGGHGFGASFPIPPYSQDADFSSQPATVSLIVPVTKGQVISIKTGITTKAQVYGWATSYWNPPKSRESFVTSIVLTEEK